MIKAKRPDMIVPLYPDPSLAAKIKRMAKELNIPENALIQLAINDWIKKFKVQEGTA